MNRRRLLLLAMALGAAGPAAAQDAVEAWPGGPRVRLAHGDAAEAGTRDALVDLLGRYDARRWTFTDEVLIDRTQIPHSHPVLTIHARHREEPWLLLSTYLHESLHWFLTGRRPATEAAIIELKALYPEVPVGYPRGGSDLESTYLHLIVCWLEIEAMADVVDRPVADAVLGQWAGDHYTWIYERVRDDNAAIGDIVRRHGLIPDAA